MSALTRPKVPDGPVRVLFDELHDLHHRAGWPSLREMARQVGCSRTTVLRAFSEPAVPRWGLLELIVETLGGEVARFHELWLSASRADVPRAQQSQSAPAGGAAGTAGHPDLPDRLVLRVPRELPAVAPGFVGRTVQIRELDGLLGGLGSGVVIAALVGTAGVGKTALAVRWAHRVVDRFPDGQLYVNLRGYDPDQPVRPADALAGCLRSLGVADLDIPGDLAERAARYRSLLSGRQMLILLDNARDAAQVRELLPGTSWCVVLVTSRDALTGIVARHGAHRIDVGMLSRSDAATLLRELIGERVAAAPATADKLAEQCVRLPLALRVAAELAACRPAAGLDQLVGELADQRRRLELLDAGGDDHTAVQAVFSWSYQHLPVQAAHAFRLLGPHPGHDFDVYTVAALGRYALDEAARQLRSLSQAHLVQTGDHGRYVMHDLLRAYAVQLTVAQEDDRTRQATRRRLLDYYLHAVSTAARALYPFEQNSVPEQPARTPAPPLTDPTAARDWLEIEHANLIAACLAPDSPPAKASLLTAVLWRHLDTTGRYHDAVALHEHALQRARTVGERAAALHNLGVTYRRIGRYTEALDAYRQAISSSQQAGDQVRTASILSGMGFVHAVLGQHTDALTCAQQSLDLARATGNQPGERYALQCMATAYQRAGLHALALEHHQQALALCQAAPDRLAEARIHHGLATLNKALGRADDALKHQQEALRLSRHMHHPAGEARDLAGLGSIYGTLGRHDEARECHTRALALARQLGDPGLEAEMLNEYGQTLTAIGETKDATLLHQTALTTSEAIGNQHEHSRALDGLAATHHTQPTNPR